MHGNPPMFGHHVLWSRTPWSGTSLPAVLAFALLTLPASGSARAQGFFYSWTDAAGGSYSDAFNWNPFGVPDDPSEGAGFSLNATYDVDFSGSLTTGTASVTRGTVTFDLDAAGSPNTYSVSTLGVNPAAGNTATLVLRDGTVNSTTSLSVGASGNGNLDVFTNSTLTTGTVVVGSASGSRGDVDVDNATWNTGTATLAGGSGSTGDVSVFSDGIWNASGPIRVGQFGSGELLINSGAHREFFGIEIDDGVVTSAGATIAANPGSSGTARVFGEWNTGDFVVGNSGAATLEIVGATVMVGSTAVALAGEVTSGTVDVAANPGSTAQVSLEGESAFLGGDFGTWQTTGAMHVGGTSSDAGGNASITVNNLGQLLPDRLVIWSTGAVTVNPGGELDVDGELDVRGGTLDVNAPISSGSATVEGTGINLGGGNSWTIDGRLTVGKTGHGDLVLDGGDHLQGDFVNLGEQPGANGSIELRDAATTMNVAGSVFVGGNESGPGGAGGIEVFDGTLTIGDTLFIRPNWDIILHAGTVDPQILDVSGDVAMNGGTIDLTGGAMNVRPSGAAGADIFGDANTTVTIEGAGGVWSTRFVDEVFVGDVTPGVNHIGTLNLAGGTLGAKIVDFGDADFAGFGTLDAKVRSGGSITATGDLTLGDPGAFDGAEITGALDVGSHTVTVKTAGFLPVGASTSISGGTLVAPGGVVLPAGATLVAFGAIEARLFAHGGSKILATGDLALGDGTALDGFFSDGVLEVGAHSVTLKDANEAVLGTLTDLGDGSNPGTLVAAHGIVIEFGKNLAGFGAVDTPDDPIRPLINNGAIVGNSLAEPITLSGYVKGVGTCNNCNITGTDAPGFSTAALNRGSVSYNGTLQIEIGGTTAGAEFDQLNHVLGAGVAELGGTLEVLLIDGYSPALDNSFEIITATGGVIGMFVTELLPPLASGLTWNVNYGSDSVVLVVAAPGLPGDYNQNGVVDAAEYTIWLDTLGSTTELAADGNGSGTIDGGDYDVWRQNFGATVAGIAAATTTIAEPAAGLLLVGLGIALLAGDPRRGPFRRKGSP